jgi:putative acetyltransferase
MPIELDDLRRPAILALLDEHLAQMRATSPPESVHALDPDRLRAPDITFWSLWEDGILLGCGALKQLDPRHGEIKSMRTPSQQRRRGAGRAMLDHLIAEARARGYHRLSLETGSQPAFEAARTLYRSAGFVPCAPFADYRDDPHSVYMTRWLAPEPATASAQDP